METGNFAGMEITLSSPRRFESDVQIYNKILLAKRYSNNVLYISTPDVKLLHDSKAMTRMAISYFCHYHPDMHGETYVSDFNGNLLSGVVDGVVRSR